jgi:hypothetical protein
MSPSLLIGNSGRALEPPPCGVGSPVSKLRSLQRASARVEAEPPSMC